MVAAVEYRDSSMACFAAQVHDAQAAVRFVADHADELSGGVFERAVGPTVARGTCIGIRSQGAWGDRHVRDARSKSLAARTIHMKKRARRGGEFLRARCR